MQQGSLAGPIIVAIGVVVGAMAFAVVTTLLNTADSGTELRLSRLETTLRAESEARIRLQAEVAQAKADLARLREDLSLLANRAPVAAAPDPDAPPVDMPTAMPDEDFETPPTEGLTEEMLLAKTRFNKNITQPRNRVMMELLGPPRDSYSTDCQPVTNPRLKSLMETRQIGPIKVTMLKPALDSLERILARLKETDPDIHAKVGTHVRACSGSWRGFWRRNRSRLRRGSRFGLDSVKFALQVVCGGSQQAVDIHAEVGTHIRACSRGWRWSWRRNRSWLRRGSRFWLGSIKLALQVVCGGSQQGVDIHTEVGGHIRACSRGWRRSWRRSGSRLRRGSRFWLGHVKLALQVVCGGSQQAVDIHTEVGAHVWACSGCWCRCRSWSRNGSWCRGSCLRRTWGHIQPIGRSGQQAVEIIVGKGWALRSGRCCCRRFGLCICEVASVEQVVNIACVSGGRGGTHRCQQFVQIRNTVLWFSRRLRRGRSSMKIVQQGVHGIVSGLTCDRACAGRGGNFRLPFRWLRGDIKGVEQVVHIAHARHEQLLIGVNRMIGLRGRSGEVQRHVIGVVLAFVLDVHLGEQVVNFCIRSI